MRCRGSGQQGPGEAGEEKQAELKCSSRTESSLSSCGVVLNDLKDKSLEELTCFPSRAFELNDEVGLRGRRLVSLCAPLWAPSS